MYTDTLEWSINNLRGAQLILHVSSSFITVTLMDGAREGCEIFLATWIKRKNMLDFIWAQPIIQVTAFKGKSQWS